MPEPLELSSPIERLVHAETNVRLAFTRPLTQVDFYEARVHPKDRKHCDDLVFGGIPYLCRHASRNWKNKRKGMAFLQACLLPCSMATFAVNVTLLETPFLAIYFGKRLLPLRPRSEDATRENTIGRAIYCVSLIVNAFAAATQYHDAERTHSFSRDELWDVHARISALIQELDERRENSKPRIRDSRTLEFSMWYLNNMNTLFERRRIRELWF